MNPNFCYYVRRLVTQQSLPTWCSCIRTAQLSTTPSAMELVTQHNHRFDSKKMGTYCSTTSTTSSSIRKRHQHYNHPYIRNEKTKSSFSTTSIIASESSSAAASASVSNEIPNCNNHPIVQQSKEEQDQIIKKYYDLLKQEELELEKRAEQLTCNFYRSILRAIKVVRIGNEIDHMEFTRREQKELDENDPNSKLYKKKRKLDPRITSMVSMLPPVDRAGELHSRAEYYIQYTQEQILNEADCLAFRNIILRKSMKREVLWIDKKPIEQYIQYIHRGYEHKRWLLNDMKFYDLVSKHDIYYETIVKNQLIEFEKNATHYVDKVQQYQHYIQQIQGSSTNYNSTNANNNAFYDENILLDIIQGTNTTTNGSSSNDGDNDSDEDYYYDSSDAED